MITQTLEKELNLSDWQVKRVIKLIDDGNTIPFIARYRKDVTGSLNDETLRKFDERLRYLRNLEDKKEKIEELVLSGNLSAAEKEISDALTLTFPFMKRVLACRVCGFTGGIAVYLKNYCTITLANEYNALLMQKPKSLAAWHFISVNGFERY